MSTVILSVAKDLCGRAAHCTWHLLRAAHPHRFLATLGMTGIFAACATAPKPPMLDLKIVNARIIDGTGAPWYRGEIGVRGDTIVAVGDVNAMPAKATIDARGNVAAPGV